MGASNRSLRVSILAMKTEPRLRDAELRMLAEGQVRADSRYVRDVVDFIWTKILDRKLKAFDRLPPTERQRIATLAGLYA